MIDILDCEIEFILVPLRVAATFAAAVGQQAQSSMPPAAFLTAASMLATVLAVAHAEGSVAD